MTIMAKIGLSLAVLGATLFLPLGCANVAPRQTVAIAVTVAGGSAPTSQDIASIHKAMLPDIEKAGFRLAASSYSADYLVSVRYSPHPSGSGGYITVVSVTPNHGVSAGAAAASEFRAISNRAISEMVREPK